MLWFYRYFKGYIRVLFYGDFFEKILDITALGHISLWNTRLTKKGIEANLYCRDFKDLRINLRGKGIRAKILNKYGLPFKIEKNKNRIGIGVGLILFFVILKLLSSYVWIIDVTGNQRVSTDKILSACREIGIKTGTPTNQISSKLDSQRLLLKVDGLAWASLNIEGSRLTVNVSEVKVKKPNQSPCNLIASADGIIKKIDIKSGNCLVKTGDTIKKGDILVSGILEKPDSTQFVTSQGTITAVTTQNFSISGKFKDTVSIKTGKIKNKYVLELFSLKLPLFLGEEKEQFVSVYDKNSLKLFGTELPIALHKRSFSYVNEQEKELTGIELCQQLKNEMAHILENRECEGYQIKREEFLPCTDGLIYNVLVVSEENIAVRDELKILSDLS